MFESRVDFGILILRLVLGVQLVLHGYPRMAMGLENWNQLGIAVNPLGLGVFSIVFVFIIAIFEFLGGLGLILGVLKIPVFLLLGLTMLFSLFFKLGHPEFSSVSFFFLAVLTALFFMGFGNLTFASYFSLLLKRKKVSVKGIVKRILRKKGFGFIVDVDGNEIFFHQTALVNISFDCVKEGQVVFFDIKHTPKGPNAVNIKAKK